MANNKASIDLETEEEVSSDYDADCSSALESPRKVALVSTFCHASRHSSTSREG